MSACDDIASKSLFIFKFMFFQFIKSCVACFFVFTFTYFALVGDSSHTQIWIELGLGIRMLICI